MKHQHKIWIQFHLASDACVLSYGYPNSSPHQIREQRLNLKISELQTDLREGLIYLHEKVASMVPRPEAVRIPHAVVIPKIEFGYFTLAVLDQERAKELPLCRLYYYEVVEDMQSKLEKFIRIDRTLMDNDLLGMAQCVSSMLRKEVWLDYKSKFGGYFIDDQA